MSDRKTIVRWIARWAVTCLLPACFGSTEVKDEQFYLLEGPTVPLEKKDGPRLLVAELRAGAGYDSARLAYRLSKHELRYYGYRQWASEPARLLAELVVRHLRASGKFSEVGRGDRPRDPDGILTGFVAAIEEVDKGEAWNARLAMRFSLRDGGSDRVIARHAFDVTRPCKRRHPDDIAGSISKILADEMGKLSATIAKALAARVDSDEADDGDGDGKPGASPPRGSE